MTLVDDVHRLQGKCSELANRVDVVESKQQTTHEQVTGERGVSATLREIKQEISLLRTETKKELDDLRKLAYRLGGVIVVAAIGFAFGVLKYMA
jgi:hypothetical protein